MEKKSPDLVIVYDKYTEKMANGISGKLAGTYTCLVQSDKVFESNKNSYTNNNRILFLAEDLISQYLSMGEVTNYAIDGNYLELEDIKNKVYTCLYSLGKWRGIKVDVEKTIKALPKIEIRAYYQLKYFGDFLLFPFSYRKNSMSKRIENSFYERTVGFFLKNENIKLIIPD